MTEETQSIGARDFVAAAAAAGLNSARSLLQYQKSLLKFSSDSTATLLFRYPSSLLKTLVRQRAPSVLSVQQLSVEAMGRVVASEQRAIMKQVSRR